MEDIAEAAAARRARKKNNRAVAPTLTKLCALSASAPPRPPR